MQLKAIKLFISPNDITFVLFLSLPNKFLPSGHLLFCHIIYLVVETIILCKKQVNIYFLYYCFLFFSSSLVEENKIDLIWKDLIFGHLEDAMSGI